MDDFKKYLLSHFWDSTMLIEKFLEDPNKVIIITKPADFLIYRNIVMLAAFFGIELDEHGKRYLDKKKTEGYKLFNISHSCCKNNKKF